MGDLPKVSEYMLYLQTLFPQLDQQFTASLVTIPLTAAFLELGLYDEALVIFGKGQRDSKIQARYLTFFSSVNVIFERWIECSLRREYEEHYAQRVKDNKSVAYANNNNDSKRTKSRKVDCFAEGSAILSALNFRETVISPGSHKNQEIRRSILIPCSKHFWKRIQFYNHSTKWNELLLILP